MANDEGPTAPSEATRTELALTVTVTVVEWTSEPLVPATVTVYVPDVEEETVSVEVADPPEARVTLVGLRDGVSPAGEAEAESDTVPEKPPRLDRVIVEVAVAPAWMVRLMGLGEIVKSDD